MDKKLKNWEKHEEKVLGNREGRRMPGSGACPGLKGDVRVDCVNKYLVECKYTQNSGFRITSKLWNKIVLEALTAQRIPLLAIEIEGTRLVVCSEELFWELHKDE